MVLSRYLHLDHHTPSLTTDDALVLTVTETLDSAADLSGRPVKGQWIRNNAIARVALLLWCLFGASAVIADGLLTPAVSVISAVTGGLVILFIDLCRNRCPRPQSQQFYCSDLYRDSSCSCSPWSQIYLTVIVFDSTIRHKIYIAPLCSHCCSMVRSSFYHRYCQHYHE